LLRHGICLLALAMASLGRVGTATGQEVSAGFKAGAIVSDQSGENKFASQDRIGFIGGGFLGVKLGSRVDVQIEVLYAMKGGNENTKKDPLDSDPDELKLRYVEVPLLLKVRLRSSPGVIPELFAGPTASFELSCRFDDFPDGVSFERDCEEAGIETRAVDLGITFGGALDIPLGSGELIVDIRGNVAVQSLDDSSDPGTSTAVDGNRMISVMLGYRFHL
jgi:hypothetical protein